MTDTHQVPGLVKMGDRDDWRIDFARYGGPYIVECGLTDANPEVGNTIAKVMVSYGADGRDRDFKTTQRRAYVMAAAPMMLAALEEIVRQVSDPANASHQLGAFALGQLIADARIAIAKATVPA